MLQPYRRHLRSCPHRKKGQSFTLCRCPIWANGTLNGRRWRQSLHTTDGSRVEVILQAIEGGKDPILFQLAPSTVRRIGEAVGAFLSECRGRGLKESTLESYSKTLSHLPPDTPLEAVDPAWLDRHRQVRPITPSTWRKELETLRAFFTWCQDRKWATENPARRLRMPRVEELTTQPFTASELQRLLDATEVIASDNPAETPSIRLRARALVLTLLYSGLRVSDVAHLRRASLEEDGHLVLKVLKTGVRLKVLLHSDAVGALRGLPILGKGTYWFWTGRGHLITCIKNMRRTIQRLGAIAGVHAHPHRFRDHFAVELLTHGADIRTVQKLLGHSSVRTTEKHYAHFVASHQRLLDEAVSRLSFHPTGSTVSSFRV